MGAPAEVIDKLRRESKPEEFDIFPENWDVFLIFTKLRTQWNMAVGMGGATFVGLNYQSIEMLFKLYKIKDRRQAFEDVQIMEASALVFLNKSKGS